MSASVLPSVSAYLTVSLSPPFTSARVFPLWNLVVPSVAGQPHPSSLFPEEALLASISE